MRVGFLGTGAIAEAMVQGLAGQGHSILVSQRSTPVSAKLAAAFEDVSVASNEDLVEASDVVVVCLMAEVAEHVLPALPFRADHKVISVMTDAPHAHLLQWVAPASHVDITIPLPSVASGGTHLPCYPDAGVVRSLFGHTNSVAAVASEAALNAHFAATAICSVALAQMQVVRDWLAEFSGDPEAAEAFTVSVLAGAMKDAGRGVDAARDALNTEGGLNQTLRVHMEPSYTELRAGLDGFRARLGLPET